MGVDLHPPLSVVDRFPTPLNRGERAVLDEVVRDLSDHDEDWHVYVQPSHLGAAPDLVVASREQGVHIVEIKDWTLNSYRVGECGRESHIEVSGNGGWSCTNLDPLTQAHRYRDHFSATLVATPGRASPFTSVNACVVIPFESGARANALLRGGTRLRASDARWIRVHGSADETHDGHGSVWSARLVGARLDEASWQRFLNRMRPHDEVLEAGEPLILSGQAREIALNQNGTKVRRVKGPAGSGKTLALAARAANVLSAGKDVLALTYNITMANLLQDLIRRELRVLLDHDMATVHDRQQRLTVTHFHGLATSLGAPPDLEGHGPRMVKAMEAALSRAGPQWDAILVDEGQDYYREWWNLLRLHGLRPNGEMLLVADATQDIYARNSWIDDEHIKGAGFRGDWMRLTGSYRLSNQMHAIATAFVETYFTGDEDPPLVADAPLQPTLTDTERSWWKTRTNVAETTESYWS